MPRNKTPSPVHNLPAWRDTTYCGLDPLAERKDGRSIKTTNKRGKVTCEDCKKGPVELL